MICISDTQHRAHVIFEILALLLIPMLWSAANAAEEPHQTRLKALAIGTALVDGGLLLRWLILKLHS